MQSPVPEVTDFWVSELGQIAVLVSAAWLDGAVRRPIARRTRGRRLSAATASATLMWASFCAYEERRCVPESMLRYLSLG